MFVGRILMVDIVLNLAPNPSKLRKNFMASVIEKTIRSAFTPVIGAVANFNRKRMTAPEGGHPYLTGIHKPMTEELTLENLTVEGSIPTQLDDVICALVPTR